MREKFPEINELRAWMDGQIEKARLKAQEKLQNAQTLPGSDNDGKRYRNIAEVWENFADDDAQQTNSTKNKKKQKGGSQSREEWYQKGAAYWQTAKATLDGVLGGFGFVSPMDVKESKTFIKSLKFLERNRAVDLGAGIGRVADELLVKMFKSVDLVEQDQKYVDTAKTNLGKNSKMHDFLCVGLQDYTPKQEYYDVMWFQWVLGHLTDEDLIALLRRCRKGLSEKGVIIVKENIARGGFILDKEDMSVTRTEAQYKHIFKEANLKIIRETWQENFPSGVISCEDVRTSLNHLSEEAKLMSKMWRHYLNLKLKE
eukprot:CAMPEP_0197540274 /NCGR_PEP_ID=MMETSP1318-20131121/65307_1 /TAXON_ID=552666 /ORGANISM="Partenskyella glossopodia, Strain RCC365" /LENGTH=313 /DNA_ID=CAMNT_0043099211 /DNA_START=3 /DNA_END=940 /DNA_ORIENTATION=+